MYIDFHYYGTYAAARVAGFSVADATVIAHAAQFVDDLDGANLTVNAAGNVYRIADFKMKQTVQDIDGSGEILMTSFLPPSWDRTSPTGWSNFGIKHVRTIWSCFHFIPHFDPANPNRITYGGQLNNGQIPEEFRLICLPDSPAVARMVNDAIDHRHDINALHLLGLRMHILADTWAHTYYGGTPSWYVNEVPNTHPVTRIYPDGHEAAISWGPAPGQEPCAPPGPTNYSVPYIGHGRMGSLPDYPFIKYRYQPQWSAQPIVKDNPTDYLTAFRQMVYAMIQFRTGQPFAVNTHPAVAQDIEAMVTTILTTEQRDAMQRCQVWQQALQNRPDIGVPAVYDKDAWGNDFDATPALGQPETHYYCFCRAAADHVDLVVRHVEDTIGITLDEDVEASKITVMLRASDGRCLSHMSQQISIDGSQFFATLSPVVGENPVELIMVLPPGQNALAAGAQVKLISTETTVREYDVLGYFNATGAYYYPNMYDTQKQVWRIDRADGQPGAISSGDQIRLYNPGKQQYLTHDGNQYLLLTGGTPPETSWRLDFAF
jgi:hypothetical protein